MNINNNITIEYDADILYRIKEILETGWIKFKSIIKSKQDSKFDFFYEIENKFDEIADYLRDLKSFQNEFKYFLFVRDNILYILHKNCENDNFGHYDYALELFDFFMEIWDAKISLVNNTYDSEIQIYENSQDDFKNRYHMFRREFYREIYENSGEFSEKEMYKIHEHLRE